VQLPLPLIKNVVLIGGGHAHALALRMWAMRPLAGARLTVINPGPTAPYTGMLPGFVAGHYERDELDIDLVRLARAAGARLVLGRAVGLERLTRSVDVPGRPPIPYDVCSIDVGITSAMPRVPGFAEHAVAAKPLDAFADRWTEFAEAGVPADPSIVVVGGGVGGCELALAMAHRLRRRGSKPRLTVVDRSRVLDELADAPRGNVLKRLARAGITVGEHRTIREITADAVLFETGPALAADLVVGAAGAQPHPWLADIGLATVDGYIEIDDHLRSVTDPAVFAAGDCAHMGFDPRPKAGVFAVRQAPVLFRNLQATLTGSKLRSYKPQSDYLKLISLGEKRAVADKFRRSVSGRAMWTLKDTIDRRFMDKLGDLPDMPEDPLPPDVVEALYETLESQPPLCGGCGAKVGADVLSGPLAALPASARSDVVRLPGDDAALLDFGAVRQVITTDTLRTFVTDPFRMARIAALHAMGDIWAMGAEPQAVLVTVTLPQLARPLQSEWLAEIMAGCAEALAGTGAEIVGGHTSMGAELSLGFSITGLLDSPAITLAGARPGQHLILTRALGSGLLLAGEMQREARGVDVAALLDELETPHGIAASILVDAGATAMTDVTGFGLAGHLFNMLRESGVAAQVDLDAVPAFAGAVRLAEQGIRSHLHAANQAGVPLTTTREDVQTALLFDPQTAGGFLAALPAEASDRTRERLAESGVDARVIGSVIEGEPHITVR